MKKEELLSIVIITCNRMDELKKTLLSCIEKTTMPIEIIVVDNGSTDGTKEMVTDIQTTGNCNIRLYFSETNLGVSGGRNKGFELATSNIVLFMDDDAVFAGDSEQLDCAYNYMVENPQIGALAVDIYDLKEKGKLLDSFKNNDREQKEMLSYVGACHILRKTYDRPYLYPPKLMYGAEERYASMLYYDMGMRVEYYPGIKVLHNPSIKTRMSKINTYRNVMINQYVIKKLLLPSNLHYVATIYYLIRMIKREKFNLGQIYKDLEVAKKRYRENRNASHHLKKETIDMLCLEYGKFVIF